LAIYLGGAYNMILDNMHLEHSFDGMLIHDHLMVNWMFGYYMFLD